MAIDVGEIDRRLTTTRADRKPLDFHQSQTLEVNAGAVYADLPAKTDPQFNALGNWVNDAHNFGVLLQLFYEQKHEQRQGQELLGYSQIAPGSAIATADPNLANAYYPVLIGSAFFQQERKRSGGLLGIEWQANDKVLIDATGFLSKLEATNVNDNYLFWGSSIINGGAGEAPNPGYVVQNGTLTSATFAPKAGVNYSVYDQISRPGEGSDTNFGNIDIHINATDQLKFLGQLGVTSGHGKTPNQDVSETVPSQGTGAGYTLNGTTNAVLSTMESTGCSLASALADAQARGYAEADPGADLDGDDARAKLAILCALAFGVSVQPEQIAARTASAVTADDIARARRAGAAIRQIAHAEYDASRGRLTAWVAPVFVAGDSIFARTIGPGNAALVTGAHSGDSTLSGTGAGGDATAVAVIADLVAIARDRAAIVPPPQLSTPRTIVGLDSSALRLETSDVKLAEVV